MKDKKSKSLLSYLILFLVTTLIGWNIAFAETNSTVPSNVKLASVVGHGIIKAIDLKKRQLTIQHDAIASINWPAMTMAFSISKKVDVSKLKVGMTIDFQLEKNQDSQMIITSIKIVNEPKGSV